MEYLGTILPAGIKRGNTDEGLEIIIRQKILNSILPHLGTEEILNTTKTHFIANMAKKLILVYLYDGKQEDRDHIGLKRVDMAGDLMMQMFASAFKFQFMDQARRMIEKIKTTAAQMTYLDERTELVFD